MPPIRYERIRAFGSTLARSLAPSSILPCNKTSKTHISHMLPMLGCTHTKPIIALSRFTKPPRSDQLLLCRSRSTTQRIVSPLTINHHFCASASSHLRLRYPRFQDIQVERKTQEIYNQVDRLCEETERQEKQL
jgi:hypothetical protein